MRVKISRRNKFSHAEHERVKTGQINSKERCRKSVSTLIYQRGFASHHYAAVNSDFYVFVRLPNKYFGEPRCKKLTHFLALNLFLVVDKFMMRPIYKTKAL
jgi:hypothetical protein